MSIEQSNVVDFINISNDQNIAYASISDHLDWTENEEKHLILLQNKINNYLAFFESGEIERRFPETKGKKLVINLVLKFNPSEKGNEFLSIAENIVEDAGFGFRVDIIGGRK